MVYRGLLMRQEFVSCSKQLLIIMAQPLQVTNHPVQIPSTPLAELWLEYISTLTSLGGELMKEVGTAYWRAIKTLDGNYTSQFMSKHICGGLI